MRPMLPVAVEEIAFESFLKELPSDYHDLAYEFKAFTRSRKIKSPLQLLQVVMMYCGLDHVLRETAGIFTLQEESITDTAVHKRLKACGPWVKALLHKMLPNIKAEPGIRRLLVVDGSSLQGPGAKGTDLRVHLALELVTMTLEEVHATGPEQGESLGRYRFQAGDIVIVDRGYNHPAAILDGDARQVSIVVRLLPTAMPLYSRLDEVLPPLIDETTRLKVATVLRHATNDRVSLPVWLASKGRSCPGTVHAQRLPPAAAEAARRRCRQVAQRKGRTPSEDALLLAGWVIVFTTVPPDILSGETLLNLYRARWQVELVFKRLKSLLDLDQLRTRQGSLLGLVWVTGKLLYAAVIEHYLHKRLRLDWGRLDQERQTTPWRLLKIGRTWVDTWIRETHRWQKARLEACLKVLQERPRRRTLQTLPFEVCALLQECRKLGWNINAI